MNGALYIKHILITLVLVGVKTAKAKRRGKNEHQSCKASISSSVKLRLLEDPRLKKQIDNEQRPLKFILNSVVEHWRTEEGG